MARHDGTLIFDTKLDASGLTGGIKSLGSVAKKSLVGVTATITTVGTSLYGLGAAAIKAGITFESAFAGVKKTVNASETELAAFRKGILDLAGEMPMTADAIAGIAESAGQLGIENKNILSFTKTMADLGVATNLTGEEAASTLAKFANITGMDQSNFDRLGSTIVELGNNLATTEADIAAMAMRLAGTGKQIGLSEAQILSFAGALSSVGIEAEAGGTAFSKVFKDLQLAVETGNADLQNFATVAGMSAEKFKEEFQRDAAGAILAFIDGLGKSEQRGMSVVKVLNDLGITEAHMSDALSRASGAADLFTNALSLGSKAWEKNSALTKEAEQRYATMESRIAILRNKVTELGITFYESTNADVGGAVDLLSEYVDKIQEAFEGDGVAGAVDALGDIISELAVRLVKAAPDILEAGADLVEKLADSLIENADAVGSAVAELLVLVAETIQKFIPKLVELGGKIIQSFAKGIGDAVPILKPFTAALSLVGKNLKTLIAVTVAYVAATKSMQIVSKVRDFLKTASLAAAGYARVLATSNNAQVLLTGTMKVSDIVVGGLTKKLTLQQVATALCTKAQRALNAAWAANHVGLVVAGVVALCTVIATLVALTKKETDAQKELRKEIQEDAEAMQVNADIIKEGIESHKQKVASIQEEADAELALLSRSQALSEELAAMADENGRVSDSERARAEFILGELNEALGTEYKLTGNVIERYDEMIAKIRELIQTKKAQIVADTYEEEYKAALREENAKKDEADKNVALIADYRSRIEAAAKEAREAIKKYASEEAESVLTDKQALEMASSCNYGLSDSAKAVASEYDNMVEKMNTAQGSLNDYAGLCQTTKEAEAKYSTASMQIQLGNYDAVMAGYKRSAEEMRVLAEGSGRERINEIIETCAEIQDAEENMQNAATDAERQMWQKKIDDARAYGQSLVSAYEKNGENAAEGVAKNLQGMGEEGGKQMAEAIVASLNGTPLDLSPLTEGLKASAAAQQKEISTLGDDFAAGYAIGICSEDAKINVQNAMYTLVQAALDAGQEAQDSNSPSKEAAALGKDFADGYIKGIREGTPRVGQVSGNLAEEGLDSIREAQDSDSPAKETGYLGEDFVAGFVNAITDGKAEAGRVGGGLASEALSGIQETQDSHSASKETWALGEDFVSGYVNAITAGAASAEEAAGDLAGSTLEAIKRHMPEGMGFVLDSTEWKISKEGEHALAELKLHREIGLITEKEYYEKLECWRNEYLKKGTQDWWDYTIEIAEGFEKLSEEDKKRLSEAAEKEKAVLKDRLDLGLISETEYYLELAKIRDTYLEGSSEEWLSYTKEIAQGQKRLCEEQKKEIVSLFTDAVEKAGKSVDEVLKLQENMEKQLQASPRMHTVTFRARDKETGEETVEKFTVLNDYSKDIKALEEYRENLEAIKNRGDIPSEFLAEIGTMSMEEGMAYAKQLRNASDAQLQEHVNGWKRTMELSSEISQEFYKEEAAAAAQGLTAALEGAGKQVPEGFFDNGKTAAENFGEGFIEKISTVVAKIKSAFSSQMQGILPKISYGGGVPVYGGGNTNYFSSVVNVSAQTPAEQAALMKGITVGNVLGGNA